MVLDDDFIIDEETGHHLYEMARMNPPEDNLGEGIEIWVFAESGDIKTPHFHVCKDKIGEKKGMPVYAVDIEVSIKCIDELIVLYSRTGHSSWNGLRYMRNAIKKWLNSQAFDADMTNKEAIRQEWNRCNMSNRVKKNEL